MGFPLADYLRRVGLDSTPGPNLEGLKKLHHSQFYSIPFENLDIQLGRDIRLDPESLVEKLIYSDRGGYCFELNGLLLMALEALGFESRPLLARVHLNDPPSGRTHQLNAVRLESSTWLVDAGFGAGGPRFPMLLEDGWSLEQDGFGFRLSRDKTYGWMTQSRESSWKNSYSFEENPVFGPDIEVANFFTSHSPRSHFTTMRTVSRPTRNGRVSLQNQQLTTIEAGSKRVREVEETDTLRLLSSRFGIKLDAKFSDFKPVRDQRPPPQ